MHAGRQRNGEQVLGGISQDGRNGTARVGVLGIGDRGLAHRNVTGTDRPLDLAVLGRQELLIQIGRRALLGAGRGEHVDIGALLHRVLRRIRRHTIFKLALGSLLDEGFTGVGPDIHGDLLVGERTGHVLVGAGDAEVAVLDALVVVVEGLGGLLAGHIQALAERHPLVLHIGDVVVRQRVEARAGNALRALDFLGGFGELVIRGGHLESQLVEHGLVVPQHLSGLVERHAIRLAVDLHAIAQAGQHIIPVVECKIAVLGRDVGVKVDDLTIGDRVDQPARVRLGDGRQILRALHRGGELLLQVAVAGLVLQSHLDVRVLFHERIGQALQGLLLVACHAVPERDLNVSLDVGDDLVGLSTIARRVGRTTSR